VARGSPPCIIRAKSEERQGVNNIVGAALQDTGNRQSEHVGRLIWAISLAYFGMWMLTITPIILSLPMRLSQIDPINSVANQSMVIGIGAFVMMCSAPFWGALSDFTVTPFGRRRPYLLGGYVIGALASVVMAISSNIVVITVAWCVAYSLLECALTILLACIGDFLPAKHRGRAGAGISVATSLASIAGSYLVGWAHPDPVGMFCLPLVASLFVVPWVLFVVPDYSASTEFRVDVRSAARLAFARNTQRLQSNFVILLASRFLVFGGLAIYVIYQAFDITTHIGAPAGSVPHIVFMAAIAAAAASLIFAPLVGFLSDRIGSRRYFALGGGLMLACGLVAMAITASPGGFIAGTCLLGAGIGMYNSQSIALSAAAAKGENVMGKSMGLVTMVGILPRVVVPLVVPLFLSLEKVDNYPMLFVVAAAMAVVGALAMLQVKTAPKM